MLPKPQLGCPNDLIRKDTSKVNFNLREQALDLIRQDPIILNDTIVSGKMVFHRNG